MIAGINKIEIVPSTGASLPMDTIRRAPAAGIAYADIVLANGVVWDDIGAEHEYTNLRPKPKEKDGTTYWEATIPVAINGLTPTLLAQRADMHDNYYLLLITDNNNFRWLVGLPNQPVKAQLSPDILEDIAGNSGLIIDFTMQQVYMPIAIL